MEPCLFRHGKWQGGCEDEDIKNTLQWSHVFSDMVRGDGHPVHAERGVASMEPCLFRHGKSTKYALISAGRNPLQWSHVFSDMVSGARLLISASISAALQWSHVFSDMVRIHLPADILARMTGFNGAMSFQTW
ncbi:protein of unknown function [Methanoculleus bourgensis]|nr:protein of unknown function [Methanoculleus bourgensis]